MLLTNTFSLFAHTSGTASSTAAGLAKPSAKWKTCTAVLKQNVCAHGGNVAAEQAWPSSTSVCVPAQQGSRWLKWTLLFGRDACARQAESLAIHVSSTLHIKMQQSSLGQADSDLAAKPNTNTT